MEKMGRWKSLRKLQKRDEETVSMKVRQRDMGYGMRYFL